MRGEKRKPAASAEKPLQISTSLVTASPARVAVLEDLQFPLGKYVLTARRKQTRQEKVDSILPLYVDERCVLPGPLAQLIVEYAGLMFIGKKSLCWIEFA